MGAGAALRRSGADFLARAQQTDGLVVTTSFLRQNFPDPHRGLLPLPFLFTVDFRRKMIF